MYKTYSTLYNTKCLSSTNNAKYILPLNIGQTIELAPPEPLYKFNNNNKDPEKWGPHLWYYLHTVAANFPTNPTEQEVHDMKLWLKTLSTTIPCKKCSFHYKNFIDNYENFLEDICKNKKKLFEFLVDCHNEVNKRNNKPELSYKEARELYPTSSKNCC